MREFLESNTYFNYEHPEVERFAEATGAGLEGNKVEQAVKLYYEVRDRIPYFPYVTPFNADSFKASAALEAKDGTFCIPKAALLGAAARYWGIPTRLVLADVRNHLASQKFVEWLGSDVFVMHGYVELYLEGHWRAATPAFNEDLCLRLGVDPLEFNGREDSVFQQSTSDGRKHMEYLKRHGYFADVPVPKIMEAIQMAYPHLFNVEGVS